MAKQPSTFLGLNLKPTYGELVNTISEGKNKIKYPDRRASILRRSFEYSKFDGIGNLQMERENFKKNIEMEKEQLIREHAEDYKLDFGEVKIIP